MRIIVTPKKAYISIIMTLLFFTQLFAQQRKVTITVDDLLATPADANEYEYISDNILKTLLENNVKAVGFVNESRLYTNEEPDSTKIKILEKWMKSDMELGNHTFSHVYINNTSIEDYKKDVIKGELITRPLLKKYDKELKYFRHPQLRTGPTDAYRSELTNFLKNRGYIIAPVTIDNDEYIHAFCYANAKKEGNTLLMAKIGRDYIDYMRSVFDFYEKLSASFLGYEVPQTLLIHANNLNADYLDELVELIKNRGYVFISIDEALKDRGYKLPEGTHSRGPSWIQRWMIADGKKPGAHPPVSKFIEELYQKYRG